MTASRHSVDFGDVDDEMTLANLFLAVRASSEVADDTVLVVADGISAPSAVDEVL